MAEPMAKAIVVRERFPNYEDLEGKENGGAYKRLQQSEKGSLTFRRQKAKKIVETKGKSTFVRERFPYYQALEGKENCRDQGKGYIRQRKVP